MKAVPGEALADAVNAYLADESSQNREALIRTYEQFCCWRTTYERDRNRGLQSNEFDEELLAAIGTLVASLRCRRAVH